MSLRETSIEERSIIKPLAATSNFSAVLFLLAGSLIGTPVFNCDPMTCPSGSSAGADNPMPAPHSRVN
jgi:hypothetical protein